MPGERHQATIDSISTQLRKEQPNVSQTVIDAKTFKQFKDKCEYDKMEPIRQKAVLQKDVQNDKYIEELKAKTLGYAESHMQFYKNNNSTVKKNKKIKNDVKAVEELDKFMVEGMSNGNASEEEDQ